MGTVTFGSVQYCIILLFYFFAYNAIDLENSKTGEIAQIQ